MGSREEGLETCAEVRENLYPFLLRAVSASERDQILSHTAVCVACRLTLDAVRERLEGVLEVEAPARGDGRPSPRRPRFLLRLLYLVPSVIAFSLLLVQGLRLGHQRYEQLFVNRLTRAIYLYREDFGRFPASDQPLALLLGTTERGGPYLDLKRERVDPEHQFRDRWGQRYQYRFPGRVDARLFEIQSNGQNGRDDDCRRDDICSYSPERPR